MCTPLTFHEKSGGKLQTSSDYKLELTLQNVCGPAELSLLSLDFRVCWMSSSVKQESFSIPLQVMTVVS